MEVMMWDKVKEVMTTKVVYAQASTSYEELVRLLTERYVSAVPVVDADRRVLGIVSEADLLLKRQHPANHFQRFLLEGKQRRLESAKAKGATAAALMSRPAITIDQEAPVVEAARLLHKHLVKQLPVVDPQGRLVGIISRSDLLRVFLRPDREIVDDGTVVPQGHGMARPVSRDR